MKLLAFLLLILHLLLFSLPANAVSVAMVVWRGQTEAERGFIKGLEDLGFEPSVTVFDAEQERRKLSQIIRNDLGGDLNAYDYVYSFGTTATKALKAHLRGSKPHIFNIVSYPQKSGILPNEQGGQRNTAGVSSRILTEVQIKNAMLIMPVEKLAVAFNPRESNSTLQLEKMIELGDEYGFDVVPLRIRPDDELFLSDLKKIEQHKHLSAIYLPSDSYLISKAEEVIGYINDAELPSICAVSAYLDKGCLVGTAANYEALGKLAASIVKLHQEGVELSDIPVKFDIDPTLIINEETKKRLQLNTIRNAQFTD